jgi:carbamoyltransferase
MLCEPSHPAFRPAAGVHGDRDLITLGISALDKESTVAILRDDEILYAVSEERLTRIKQQSGFPFQALREGLDETGLSLDDVDAVCHSFLTTDQELKLRRKAVHDNIPYVLGNRSYPLAARLAHLANSQRILPFSVIPKFNRALEDGLASLGVRDKLVRYHHQLCHAASAYYTADVDKALIVTLDGYGSGLAGGFFLGQGGRIKMVQPIPYPHSMGGFYGGITQRLGFILHRHEGKVLGLAAYGDPTILYDRVRRRFDTSKSDYFRFIDANNILFDLLIARRFAREHVAAAYQAVLEEVVCQYIATHLRQCETDVVCLAGGVCANVKLNQRIMEIEGVREVHVHPGMSDVGTALGACLVHVSARNGGLAPRPMNDAYLSRDFTSAEMKTAIAQAGIPHHYYSNGAEPTIAELLNARHVIGRFNGRMEYGPRALGNRSILYDAGDPSVNEWLNRKLRRTEFMPFAPAVIGEDASRYFKGLDRAARSAEFMTITFDCTEAMKDDCPAAVHVDGTARPQLVYERSNASFHRILHEYRRLSGKSGVINTSFNMHEEPIVYSPDDAIRAFRDSGIDYLAMGDFICWQPGSESTALH